MSDTPADEAGIEQPPEDRDQDPNASDSEGTSRNAAGLSPFTAGPWFSPAMKAIVEANYVGAEAIRASRMHQIFAARAFPRCERLSSS